VNHFLGLIILSLCIATVFVIVNRERKQDRVRYFLRLLAYMIVGSLLFAWVMYFIPW
jgi:uncharacterized membrane protein